MVSLIVCTLGRVQEVERLLASLERQTYKDCEVLLVDQNGDHRLAPVVKAHPTLEIRHLRSAPGLSLARNVGLRFARGEIIAVPDDDCWYPERLLQSVAEWFDMHLGFGGLSAMTRSADNTPVGPPWPDFGREITTENVWGCAISTTIFLRRSLTERVGLFNEDIGVGAPTKYQAGEETDYLLRALKMGIRIWLEPTFTVHHPPLASMDRLRRKTYPFALGTGYVMRVHGYSWRDFGGYLLRSLGGAVRSLCRGDIEMAKVYVMRAAGQVCGYWLGPRDLARIAGARTN